MKSLASLLLLVVLIGLSASMSVLDNEVDDVKGSDVGWVFKGHHNHNHHHHHHHSHHSHSDDDYNDNGPDDNDDDNPDNDLETSQESLGCTGNPCYLCKNSAFDVSLYQNMISAAYEYNGCLVISKTPDNKYKVGLTLNNVPQYENAYEVNENVNLPCIYPDESKPEGKICPRIYNVDLENGEMCASLDEYLQIKGTKLTHENNIGCAEIY